MTKFFLIICIAISGCAIDSKKPINFKVQEISGPRSSLVKNYIKQLSNNKGEVEVSAEYEVQEKPLISLKNNNSLFNLLEVSGSIKCKEKTKKFKLLWQHKSEDYWKYNSKIYQSIANKIYFEAQKTCL